MKGVYLVNYSVRGIKTLDQLVSLSFYKKTISKNPDTRNYNVKGIYGINGSGKSGIVTSVEILRNLLIDPGYLNNPVAQKNLAAIINKKLDELFIEVDYLVTVEDVVRLFRYRITISKQESERFIISQESLEEKKSLSGSKAMQPIFEVRNGELQHAYAEAGQSASAKELQKKTMNLLSTASLSSLFYEKILRNMLEIKGANILYAGLCSLYVFGRNLHVYLDQSDNHRSYAAQSFWKEYEGTGTQQNMVIYQMLRLGYDDLETVLFSENVVLKKDFEQFEKNIDRLYRFLHIFKKDLQGVEIEKKENHDCWVCDLIMAYDSYKIHAEYESTGIKKLIRLFAYLREMVQGGIVFIDEFDSNLHDVYLCALLEYLMEYGAGQLCFTTHNVGPMDVLRQHKKSIDFLSENHQIYPWTTNGNYSPAKLYRNGMIEGSPFNVDSIDFIGVLGAGREED